jgi:glycosyltransferase involved in cell wall biosynthesis
MTRLRVMMIGPYPRTPETFNGGVSSAMMYLTDALVASGEVELIGIRIAKNRRDLCNAARFSHPIEEMPLGRLSLSMLYRRQLCRLRSLIRQYRPDLVHAQGADIGGYLAVRSDRPAVVTVHGLLRECARFQTGTISMVRALMAAALTERGTIHRASNVIAISPYVRSYYEGQLRSRVFDVPNPVSPAFFGVTRLAEPGRLLYAGRIANGKGLSDLVQALARCRNRRAKLVLAGATLDPAFQRSLQNEIGRLGLADRVSFVGLLNEPALLEEFARAEALVLPSYQETAPMVVQQAMAASIPVIATRVGGIPYQIEHEVTGFLFDAGDTDELAKLIARLHDDPGFAHSVGLAARARARERYESSAVAAATVSVYRSMMGLVQETAG